MPRKVSKRKNRRSSFFELQELADHVGQKPVAYTKLDEIAWAAQCSLGHPDCGVGVPAHVLNVHAVGDDARQPSNDPVINLLESPGREAVHRFLTDIESVRFEFELLPDVAGYSHARSELLSRRNLA